MLAVRSLKVGTCLLAVLLAALPTAGQAQVPPDTLDGHRYYPLAVGNVWEYHEAELPRHFTRHTLTSDTTVGAHRYFRRVTHFEAPTATDTIRWTEYDYVRYDTAGVVVAVPSPGADTVAVDPCWGDAFMRDLRLGFGAVVPCPEPGWWPGPDSVVVEGAYNTVWQPEVLSGTAQYVEVAAVKNFYINQLIWTGFVADVGPTGSGNLWGPRLHYARIGGVEYGNPEITLAQEPFTPEAAALEVRVLGNPVRGRAAFEVRAASPQWAQADVLDALGRRLWRNALVLSPAWVRVEVPVSSLGSGTHFLRVSTERGAVSRPFSVVR